MAKDKDKKDGGAAIAEAGPPPRLREQFRQEISPKLSEQFDHKNPMSRPKLEKIVVNINMGRHLEGTKVPANVKDTVVSSLKTITGQKPVVIKAKRSVSNFKVREGYETSAMVTLRQDRMWHFLDRLINLAMPRIKDFRGMNDKAFDRGGNYSLGLTEQGVFPEIDMAKATFTHGMHVNLVFQNSNPAMSRFVLEELGFPFHREEKKK